MSMMLACCCQIDLGSAGQFSSPCQGVVGRKAHHWPNSSAPGVYAVCECCMVTIPNQGSASQFSSLYQGVVGRKAHRWPNSSVPGVCAVCECCMVTNPAKAQQASCHPKVRILWAGKPTVGQSHQCLMHVQYVNASWSRLQSGLSGPVVIPKSGCCGPGSPPLAKLISAQAVLGMQCAQPHGKYRTSLMLECILEGKRGEPPARRSRASCNLLHYGFEDRTQDRPGSGRHTR